jgi:hypothetical protein
MGIAIKDLQDLLRNYARLEQAGARMFHDWSEEAIDPEMKSTLAEFAEIEKKQALALALHLKELGGGELGSAPLPIEDAIGLYLEQIGRLPTIAERLRFNYSVMSTLERPVIMRALLSANPDTLSLFQGILQNEDRILTWCDQTSSRLGCESVDIDKYYSDVVANVG